MERSSLRWLIPWAIPAALIGALAHFLLSPMPPEQLLRSPGSRPIEPESWEEWRDPAFFDLRTALDRSHPVEVVRGVLESFRAHEYRRVLAFSTHRLQSRYTPDQLRLEFGLSPGFTAWEEVHVDTVNVRESRVVIRGRSVTPDQTMYFHASLLEEDDGWALDSFHMSRSRRDAESQDPPPDEPPAPNDASPQRRAEPAVPAVVP